MPAGVDVGEPHRRFRAPRCWGWGSSLGDSRIHFGGRKASRRCGMPAGVDVGEPHRRFRAPRCWGWGSAAAFPGILRSADRAGEPPWPPDWCCAHGSAVRSGTRRGCDAAHPVHGVTVAIHQRVDAEAPSKRRGPPQGRWLRQPFLPQQVKDCGVGLVFEPGR